MSEHSLLSPSGAHCWARCPGALLLCKGIPDKTSEAAASGTLTHAIAELLLRIDAGGNDGVDITEWGYDVGTTHEVDGFKFVIDQDRLDRANAYVKAILREPGRKAFEHRLNTSPILGLPNQEGHADCVVVDPTGVVLIDGVEHHGVVSVHDLKDGNGIVWAKDNLQGLIYGASALYEFELTAPLNAVRFCIHQPRQNHYDEWSYSRAEIASFVAAIRPVAKLAYDLYHGNIDFDPERHLIAGETQCQWCDARGSCPARAKRIMNMFEPLTTRHQIDDDTLGQIYARLDEIESACRDFRGEALARALNGRVIKGQKIVRGKRGPRYWKDAKAAEAALVMLTPDAYEKPSIISPTTAEKKLKELYAAVQEYVGQNEGGLSLAPLDDKRSAVTTEQFEVLENAK